MFMEINRVLCIMGEEELEQQHKILYMPLLQGLTENMHKLTQS